MLSDFIFNETRIRLFNCLIWLAIFIDRNWGSTSQGIKHIVLSSRTSSFETVDGELANAIGGTIIPFGETATNFLVIGTLYICADWFVRKIDLDRKRIKSSSAMLKKENEYLLKDLRKVNMELNAFLDTTSELPDKISELNKYQDRVAELSIDLEGLFQKGERSKRGPFETVKNDSLDLFDIQRPKTKKRRPPRHSYKSNPKF